MVQCAIQKITENTTKYRYSEFSSHKIELTNRARQNNITLQVTNSKIFKEIFLQY